MAPNLLGFSGANATNWNNVFFSVDGYLRDATEGNVTRTVRKGGVFSNLSVTVNATGTGRVLTLRKNSANTTLSVTATDSTTGTFTNNRASVSYAVGDTIALNNVVTSGGSFTSVNLVFSANAGVGGQYGTIFMANGAGVAFAAFGANFFLTTEASNVFVVRAPGVYSNMTARVTANTAAASNVITSRKNSAAGTQTITIGAAATGVFEDTTHTDTYAAGDTFDFDNSTNSNGISTQFYMTVAHSSNLTELPAGQWNVSAGTTVFLPILYNASGSALPLTAESGTITQPQIPGIITNMRCRINTNTSTGIATFTLRKNSVSGANTFAVGASTTGSFEDTTHSDAFVANDAINYQVVVAAGTGTANIQSMSATLAPAPIPNLTPDMRIGPRRIRAQLSDASLSLNLCIRPGQAAALPFKTLDYSNWPYRIRTPQPGVQPYNMPIYSLASEPFAPVDYSRALARLGQLDLTTRPLNLSLLFPIAPFIPVDYSAITPRIPRAPDQVYPNWAMLFSQPFSQLEWGRVFVPARERPEATRALNINLFTNPIPFAQFDWNRPLGIAPPPPQSLPFNLSLNIIIQAPFALYDWNTVAPPRLAVPLTLPLNLSLFTNPIPFSQFDWSKPFGLPPAKPNPTDALNLQLFTNPIPFFNLVGSPFVDQSFTPPQMPYNAALYTIVLAALPFAQFDWSKPAPPQLGSIYGSVQGSFVPLLVSPQPVAIVMMGQSWM